MFPLFAHSRHIALPPVFVYGFGAIFDKITAIDRLKSPETSAIGWTIPL